MPDDNERILALEIKVENLDETIKAMSGKIDTLLEFKHKWIGAVLLLSVIIGSGLAATVAALFRWARGG